MKSNNNKDFGKAGGEEAKGPIVPEHSSCTIFAPGEFAKLQNVMSIAHISEGAPETGPNRLRDVNNEILNEIIHVSTTHADGSKTKSQTIIKPDPSIRNSCSGAEAISQETAVGRQGKPEPEEPLQAVGQFIVPRECFGYIIASDNPTSKASENQAQNKIKENKKENESSSQEPPAKQPEKLTKQQQLQQKRQQRKQNTTPPPVSSKTYGDAAKSGSQRPDKVRRCNHCGSVDHLQRGCPNAGISRETALQNEQKRQEAADAGARDAKKEIDRENEERKKQELEALRAETARREEEEKLDKMERDRLLAERYNEENFWAEVPKVELSDDETRAMRIACARNSGEIPCATSYLRLWAEESESNIPNQIFSLFNMYKKSLFSFSLLLSLYYLYLVVYILIVGEILSELTFSSIFWALLSGPSGQIKFLIREIVGQAIFLLIFSAIGCLNIVCWWDMIALKFSYWTYEKTLETCVASYSVEIHNVCFSNRTDDELITSDDRSDAMQFTEIKHYDPLQTYANYSFQVKFKPRESYFEKAIKVPDYLTLFDVRQLVSIELIAQILSATTLNLDKPMEELKVIIKQTAQRSLTIHFNRYEASFNLIFANTVRLAEYILAHRKRENVLAPRQCPDLH